MCKVSTHKIKYVFVRFKLVGTTGKRLMGSRYQSVDIEVKVLAKSNLLAITTFKKENQKASILQSPVASHEETKKNKEVSQSVTQQSWGVLRISDFLISSATMQQCSVSVSKP